MGWARNLQSGYLRADEAIRGRSEDRLGRRPFAEDIARQVMGGPDDLGLVIGLVGDWGTGKTSVVNMVHEFVAEESDMIIVPFDPWLFSGTDELVTRFLQELSAHLGRDGTENGANVRKASDAVLRYAEALDPLVWIPGVGPWMARAASMARGVKGLRGDRGTLTSVVSTREAVRSALAQLDRRVLVTVDDVDRLEHEQIRDVMRLVTLVGNFPNTTYLIAYSRRIVERALSRQWWANPTDEGALYLEKIVQASYDLPEANPRLLLRAFANELEAAVAGITCGPLDRERWSEMLIEGILPFVRTARASGRLLNVLPTTLRLLGDRVGFVDVVALETIRLFAPNAWALLPGAFAALTGEYPPSDSQLERNMYAKSQIQAICDADVSHAAGVEAIMRRIFPRAEAYLDDRLPTGDPSESDMRRAYDPDVLRTYLRGQTAEDTVSSALVRRAAALASDVTALEVLIDSLDAQRAEETIVGIGDLALEFDEAEVGALVEVILKQSSRVSDQHVGVLDLTPSDQLLRVIVKLLQVLDNEDARNAILITSLPKAPSLSIRLAVLELVSHEGECERGPLVAAAEGKALVSMLVRDVTNTSTETLRDEKRLFQLFSAVADDRDASEGLTFIRRSLQDPAIMLRVIRSALSALDGAIGNLPVGSTVPWAVLSRWLEGDTTLVARLHEVVDQQALAGDPTELQVAAEVAREYLAAAGR